MTTPTETPADQLASLISPDTQKLAARMAQDSFAEVFRLTLNGAADPADKQLATLETQCFNWSRAAQDDDARSLRLALLMSGMDQWGLAYTQAFGLIAIPALTQLLGGLRNRLDAKQDAHLQRYFNQIGEVETDAIDFKIELRRGIHMALWHAMIACDDVAAAQSILQCLGSLMLVLVKRMPQVGWRLVADALANIQLRLLTNTTELPVLAQEITPQLFESLREVLDQQTYRAVRTSADQTLVAWQQAKRAGLQ